MTETIKYYGKLVQKEIAGEDYAKNKHRDREEALSEAIADAVNELKVTIRTMLMHYHCDYDPSLGRESELHREAIERIKKCLQ